MTEWHVSGQYSQQRHPAAGPAGGVEWYSAGAGQQYGASTYSYDMPGGQGGAAFGSFDDEPPLLEELGIDIPSILRRTRSVLTFQLSGHDMEHLDMGGPLIFMALLGFAHLLVGKMHFGYILGWMVVGAILLWSVLNSITGSDDPDATSLDLYSCTCLLGYALLPLVLHALLALALPRRSTPSLALAGGAVLWSAMTAARLFVRRSPLLGGQHGVVLYPSMSLAMSARSVTAGLCAARPAARPASRRARLAAPVRATADKPEGTSAVADSPEEVTATTPLASTSAPKQATPASGFSGSSLTIGQLMAFSGPAPELVNGRLAMIGVVAALAAELSSGESVLRQFADEPTGVLLTAITFITASLIPLLATGSTERKAVGPFTPAAEMLNGRAAMIGLASLIAIEARRARAAVAVRATAEKPDAVEVDSTKPGTIFFAGKAYSEEEYTAAVASGGLRKQAPGASGSASASSLSLGELMAFSGPAPELVNGRLAMIGVVAALAAELSSGESVLRQFADEPTGVVLTGLTFIAASLIPLLSSTERKAVGPFTPAAEMLNGRAAMIGLASLIAIEAVRGSALFWNCHGAGFSGWWLALPADEKAAFLHSSYLGIPQRRGDSTAQVDGNTVNAGGRRARPAEGFEQRMAQAQRADQQDAEGAVQLLVDALEERDGQYMVMLLKNSMVHPLPGSPPRGSIVVCMKEGLQVFTVNDTPGASAQVAAFRQRAGLAAMDASAYYLMCLRQTVLLGALLAWGEGYRQDALGREGAMYGQKALGCSLCGALEGRDGGPLMTCSACKWAVYCSTECQNKDLRSHKEDCKRARAARQEKAAAGAAQQQGQAAEQAGGSGT
ncbi:integral membrane Yip1-family isoform B [Micractinium conductrix]|uniref:Integral membrane Yip1-family isoform B n=1 Tax=Micractinium conductrix TaxID=554055 RepID=A0A2P6VQE7_9CHLO|nr:integral membrane Yip1-family isoform B [Micractinium conductrix]|eukprot:PSC76290.1 integral membrane Yip1-family isoform B [Micractinium conductrix]